MKNRAFKLIVGIITITMGLALITGCSKTSSGDVKIVKIGTKTDDTEIWDALNDKLKDENIQVQIVNFSTTNPNEALANKEIDLNAFQHYMYFNKNKSDLNLDITSIGDMFIFPLDLYSKKVKSIDQLTKGGKIGVPNDPTNIGMSLNVLQEAGLIKLKDGVGLLPEFIDITDQKDQDYINLIAARTEDKDNETYNVRTFEGYPSRTWIEHYSKEIEGKGYDIIIGIGGGKVMDLTKAIGFINKRH